VGQWPSSDWAQQCSGPSGDEAAVDGRPVCLQSQGDVPRVSIVKAIEKQMGALDLMVQAIESYAADMHGLKVRLAENLVDTAIPWTCHHEVGLVWGGAVKASRTCTVSICSLARRQKQSSMPCCSWLPGPVLSRCHQAHLQSCDSCSRSWWTSGGAQLDINNMRFVSTIRRPHYERNRPTT